MILNNVDTEFKILWYFIEDFKNNSRSWEKVKKLVLYSDFWGQCESCDKDMWIFEIFKSGNWKLVIETMVSTHIQKTLYEWTFSLMYANLLRAVPTTFYDSDSRLGMTASA